MWQTVQLLITIDTIMKETIEADRKTEWIKTEYKYIIG